MPKKKKEAPLTGITVSKEEDFSGWFTELINKAELADIRYNIKGFVVYREWPTITIKKMYAKYEKCLEDKGHMPLTMPSLIPESNFFLARDSSPFKKNTLRLLGPIDESPLTVNLFVYGIPKCFLISP